MHLTLDPRTIRGALTRWLVLVLGAVLIVATLLLRWILVSWLEQEFDSALETKGRFFVTLISQAHGEIELNFADEFMPEFERVKNPEFFQLWSSTGEVVERSRSLGKENLGRENSPNGLSLTFRDVKLPDGRPGRSIQIDFVPQVEDDDGIDVDVPMDPNSLEGTPYLGATIVLASGVETLSMLVRRLDGTLLLFSGLVLLATIVSVANGLKRGLRPLRRLASAVRSLEAKSLGAKVHLPGAPLELRPVLDQLNQLLVRLDDAFRRERTLSGNLAHELRTPIAELRNLAEVAQEWPDDREAIRRYFADVQAIGDEMQTLVQQLLMLARYEADQEDLTRSSVDLGEAMQGAWDRCREIVADSDAVLRRDGTEGAVLVETDPEKLAIILQNLLANAVTYRTPGSEVEWRAASLDNGRTSLHLANFTVGLKNEDLDSMFDRFWRRDAARTGDGHLGLGLTLVRSLADLLQIEVRTMIDEESRIVFELLFTDSEPSKGRTRLVPSGLRESSG